MREMENELDENLIRNDKFHKLFIKIDAAFDSIHVLNVSLNSLAASSENNSSTSNSVKVKLPKLQISKMAISHVERPFGNNLIPQLIQMIC